MLKKELLKSVCWLFTAYRRKYNVILPQENKFIVGQWGLKCFLYLKQQEVTVYKEYVTKKILRRHNRNSILSKIQKRKIIEINRKNYRSENPTKDVRHTLLCHISSKYRSIFNIEVAKNMLSLKLNFYDQRFFFSIKPFFPLCNLIHKKYF